MDCNPRVQLIRICVPTEAWTAIPESKIPQVLLTGTKMNTPPPPPEKETTLLALALKEFQGSAAASVEIPLLPATNCSPSFW